MADMEVMEVMDSVLMAVDTDMAATMEDMVDMVMDTEAMDMVVTTMARDPLMPNLKLMPDICMEDTVMEDMEVMEVMDLVLMAVDTDIAALVTMEDMVYMAMDTEAMDMVVTTMARDPLMLNLKRMPDICMVDTVMEDMEVMVTVLMVVDTDIAALVIMEDMVVVLDMEVMAVSGDKHSHVVLPIFL